MAASPTPPQPNTATVSPRRTSPVSMAAPRPAMTPQPSRPGDLGLGRGVDLACTGRRPPASCRRRRRCRGRATAPCRRSASSSAWRCAWRSSTRCGRPCRHDRHSPHTARQLRIDEVAGRHVGDVGAHRLDHAGGLVAEQEREVVVDAALAVVQVGVAHAARLHLRRAPRRGRGRARRSSRSSPARPCPGPPPRVPRAPSSSPSCGAAAPVVTSATTLRRRGRGRHP